ncbi:MAG: hypothetical protein IKG22_15705 [Atopobiaceae bacterium]|nr:hypothetical protein [Atopobiaceae bacterium]
MDAARIAKSNQEQAVAAWIGYLNQLRIDSLLEALHSNEASSRAELAAALAAINDAIGTIEVEIIERNRGGEPGMHGYIAEVAEEGVENARRLIVGEAANTRWVNDNGPVDLRRGGIDIQMKFVNASGRFSLGAVAEHLQKYPDFVSEGGKYQIPRDHYERVRMLYEMSEAEAGKLSRSGGGPSLRDWRRVQEFFEETSLGIDDLEPSQLSYREVQRGTIHATLEGKKGELRETSRARRERADEAAYLQSRPTLQEAAKATAVSAAVEGGTAFVMAVASKMKEGKRLKDFNGDDWAEIGGKTGMGLATGGVRGASIYGLTNYTATSAAVASAIVTSSFGIAEQAHRMREGQIGEVEFIENAEMLCLDASVSALSSFVGQALIPVPVLGAVIGNTVGCIMYQAAKDGLSAKEHALVEAYAREQRELDARLESEYGNLLDSLNSGMVSYIALLERAFDPDPALAFKGSIALARELGVPDDQILDSREKAMAYFLD